MTTALAPSSFAHRYGPWAVVTGASDGIGRAFVDSLVARGVRVVAVARRKDRLDEVKAAHADGAVVVVAHDVKGGSGAIVDAVADKDVGLVVAAAGFGTSGAFVDADKDAELDMIDVNVRAVADLVHVFAPRLVARGQGGLVLLSSLLAFQGVPRAANYAATKAWAQTFAEGLQGELGPRGVDVVACAPGPVESGFAARADMKMGAAVSPVDVAEGTLRRLAGGGTVRPGWLSWLLEASLAPLPRFGRSLALARVMAGMTRHQP